MQTIVSLYLISLVTSHCAAFIFMLFKAFEQKANKQISVLHKERRHKETDSKDKALNKLYLQLKKNTY